MRSSPIQGNAVNIKGVSILVVEKIFSIAEHKHSTNFPTASKDLLFMGGISSNCVLTKSPLIVKLTNRART